MRKAERSGIPPNGERDSAAHRKIALRNTPLSTTGHIPAILEPTAIARVLLLGIPTQTPLYVIIGIFELSAFCHAPSDAFTKTWFVIAFIRAAYRDPDGTVLGVSLLDEVTQLGFVKCLRGLGSGKEYPPDTVMNLCPVDGRPVEMVLDLERLKKARPERAWYHPERKDMWRFGALLPLDIDDPDDLPHIVGLGEGNTPQLDYSDYTLARQAGIRFEVKDEGIAWPGYGANPTRSFKDRGMAVVASMARKSGLRKLVVPTQGNAGDSLSEYALAAGLEVAVIMPETTPMPILGKVAAYAKIYDSVHLDLVRGTIREAGQLAKHSYLGKGYFSVATFQEPGWRIEGKKTLGLELAEPRDGTDRWRLPDAIIYPTGGGTGILGMWKAFNELEALGLIGPHRPKIISVQSEATQPLVRAFRAGAEDTTAVEAGATMAVGLNVPGGVGHFEVLRILRQSKGWALAVTEQEMGTELKRAYREKGWWLTPEGAAAVAALKPLLAMSLIGEGDHVVAFNTGSFEKYLPDISHLLFS